jgi:hypothetical protein
MRHLVGFVLFLLALGTLRTVGCGNDCYWDSDCDDGNPCTRDDCNYYSGGPYSGFSFCGPEFHACGYTRVDDGTLCEVDGQTGVCEARSCRPDGEPSEPGGDGGV